MDENKLKEWEQKERPVTLTNKQWNTLVVYLLMSTKHREGEQEAWESLAKETNPDGSPCFKNAASNAEYWKEMIAELELIVPKLDGTAA